MVLYQTILLAALTLSQGQTLEDLEKRAQTLSANTTWSMQTNKDKVQLNQDLLKLIDSNVLKTGDEFRRASRVVQYLRGDLKECRMRYELTITAIASGESSAARALKMNWDQLLLSTGRLQHMGTMKPFQGLQADKFVVNPTVTSVQTVYDDPEKARADSAKLAANAEIKKLVEEDQKVRQADWSKLTQSQMLEISKADDQRRAALKSLLKDIKLMTAQDYRDASLVMQHGSWFDDYALAHELAMCATVLDPKVGKQLVALTYDRMLESGGYQQRVGTQYHGTTLATVDASGFSDNMRVALGRKPLAEVPKELGGG